MLCHIQIHLLILLEILSFLSHGLNPLAAFTNLATKIAIFHETCSELAKNL